MKFIYTPEKILPAGDDYAMVVNPFTGDTKKARKGIVAATLNNIALLNQLLRDGEESKRDQINGIRDAIDQLIPSLKAVGIFDLFSIEEWLNDRHQPGRIFVAILYLNHYPEEFTKQIEIKLKEFREMNLSIFLLEELKRFRTSI